LLWDVSLNQQAVQSGLSRPVAAQRSPDSDKVTNVLKAASPRKPKQDDVLVLCRAKGGNRNLFPTFTKKIIL